ncbi:WLM-domain-containing protein [Daldinia caldariorum]|uniref:WLM-domain-containing protein n=1 Tax=Daldinia caldariorum TaxID=326644 RepID=UPI002007955E|nr:WLM-domain-containing protein [Daldinia caldariorum]KAI1464401.1 WLM-domain-containing protein [Daldinia caldariorum]
MAEIDPLVLSYSHLKDFPRQKDALHTLKKVASLVKPIMRARRWKVGQLTEFYPDEHNLLGLNVGGGQRICLRLRYASDRNQFLPIEQVVDTMLHELAHNVHGPHDAKFHALWNQLRDEHEALLMKGYTGEGFLSAGRRLGGRRIPPEEARRLARVAAENRRNLTAGSGPGQKLGGAGPRPGQDIRRVIVDAIERRNNTLRGCANDNQTQDEIRRIADTAARNGFRTQAEEDAANEAAIAQALWELVEEEERAQKGDSYIPPSSSRQATWTHGDVSEASRAPRQADRNVGKGSGKLTWACNICTLENPVDYLCCDACGTERDEKITQGLTQKSPNQQRTVIDLTGSPPPKNRNTQPPKPGSRPTARSAVPSSQSATPAKLATWTCSFCGRVRERQWWSCDMCGTVKQTS